MAKPRSTNFERLFASIPADKTARIVTGGGEAERQPEIIVIAGHEKERLERLQTALHLMTWGG